MPDLKRRIRERLRGFENLLVPSFTPDLRALDERGIRLDVRQSLAHGFVATACALDAGLTLQEQRRFVGVACEEAAGRIAVSISLGAAQERDALALIEHAHAAGASHAHLGCPQGFAPRSSEEIVVWVERVAAASALPLFIVAERFAFPQLHPSGLPLEAIEQIAQLPNVVGLGLSSLDAGLIAEVFERYGERLLIGSPHLGLLPMLRQNYGLQWSGPSAIEGLQSPQRPAAVSFLEHLLQGRTAEAMQIYWSLAPALGAVARVTGAFAHTGAQHWSLVKYQQWLSGGNGGVTRQPGMRLFQRDMDAIRGGLRSVGVECADPDAAFFAGRHGVAAA